MPPGLAVVPAPVFVPLGTRVVVPVGVIEPGAGEPLFEVDLDFEVAGVLFVGATGAMVVEGGFTGGATVDGLPGVVLGTGGIPGVGGLLAAGTVYGLPGVVFGVVGRPMVGGAPGGGVWPRSKEAASDKAGINMVSP